MGIIFSYLASFENCDRAIWIFFILNIHWFFIFFWRSGGLVVLKTFFFNCVAILFFADFNHLFAYELVMVLTQFFGVMILCAGIGINLIWLTLSVFVKFFALRFSYLCLVRLRSFFWMKRFSFFCINKSTFGAPLNSIELISEISGVKTEIWGLFWFFGFLLRF